VNLSYKKPLFQQFCHDSLKNKIPYLYLSSVHKIPTYLENKNTYVLEKISYLLPGSGLEKNNQDPDPQKTNRNIVRKHYTSKIYPKIPLIA